MDLVSANIGVVEQSLFSRILTKIGIAILAIALFDLLFVNWWILKKSKVSKDEANPASQVVNKADSDTIREITSTPSPTPSTSPTSSSKSTTQSSPIVKTETVIEKQTQTIGQTAQKEIFVPLGQGSTNSSSFADLLGTDVTIDTSKYSAIDSVVFEASIWPEGGNGRAYAQIKNVTDNNPLFESQISNSSASGVVKTSSKIPISTGAKTYRVQAKTDITNFVAHVENARIKITLR